MPLNTTICNIGMITSFFLSFLIYLKDRLFFKNVSLAPIVVFVFFTFSLFYSSNIRNAIDSINSNLNYLAIPLIFGFGASVFTPTVTKKILHAFLITILAISIISYIKLSYSAELLTPPTTNSNFTYHNPFSRYSFSRVFDMHPTYFSIYILFAIVILNLNTQFRPFIIIFFSCILSFFLLILSSKNQMLTYFLLLIVLFWTRIKLKIPFKLGLLIIIISSILFVAASNEQILYRINTEMTNSNEERSKLLIVATEIISKNPIFGVGVGDRNDEVNVLLNRKGYNSLINYNSHNQYLDFAISFGILGTICFVIVLLLPLLQKDLTFSLFIVIIALACVTESILMRQKGLMFFLIFYGILGVRHKVALLHSFDFLSKRSNSTQS
jgi:O-antigen ligase